MTTDAAVLLPTLSSVIAYVFAAYGKPLDEMVGRVYEHQLADIPLALLRDVALSAPTTRQFLPSVFELRDDCERLRQARVRATPYEPCVACRVMRPGWDVIVQPDGTPRYTRCECWRAYWAGLEASGVPARSLVPSAAPAITPAEMTRLALPEGAISPEVDAIVAKVKQLAASKAMPAVRLRKEDS